MNMDDLDSLLPPNCPNPYYDTWDKHNSIAFSTATKGLRNAPGENNCFVNSAVQVFWHLDVFRRSYRRLSGHTCMGNSCIFCALKVIFTQFQFSDQSSLHPDALRKALAETFANQQRFQLGHMDDAAECFENILRRIHYHIANGCNEDLCTAPHCLPHQKFSLNIVEKVVCPCGSSSNPLKFNEMVHYISATALVSQARVMQETGDVLHPDRFGLLLRNANAMGDIRDCPGGCGKKVQIRRTLLNSPDVVSIGLVWDSDHPSVETTTEVARNIGTTILMQDVFHSVMQDLRKMAKLQLVGLVCYYGKHYSTFVFHSKLQVWIYFDDATVREIGPRWEHVVEKCSKGRYQPLLLLYANPKAEPVSVETAPKKRVMAPGFGIPGGPEEESSLDRTQDSITSQQSQHRSRTPNPEPSKPSFDKISSRARSVTPCSSEAKDDTSSINSGEHSRQPSFLIAMSGKPDSKGRYPPRLGGQATGNGVPGPMMPAAGHSQNGAKSQLPSPQEDGENYSDYTLSTSDQYRRPSLGGFEPAKLPLTPNMKGYDESSKKEIFKRSREPVRADVVRCQVDPSQSQSIRTPQYQDSKIPPALPPKTASKQAYYQQGINSDYLHSRQRSLSQQGVDEAYASDTGSSHDGQQHHTIVKPMSGSGNYDHLDSLSHSHTPVQSGLATLPRRKKEQSIDSTSGHQKQRPSLDSENNRPASMSNAQFFQDQRPGSNPMFYAGEESRTHFTSADPRTLPAQLSSTSKEPVSKKLSDSEKKAKKLKKEMKKAEKEKRRSKTGENLQLPLDQTDSATATVTPGTTVPLSTLRPEEFRDDKIVYIDRRMVENILKSQGLQRQPSTHSTNSQTSSSSIESDSLMGRLLAAKQIEGGLPSDLSFDNVSLGSHKDSGYGSSDRNSSSSTGSGTIDPYTQYFISKSMVVPRTLNTQQMMDRPPHQLVSDFTAPNAQVYTATMSQQDGGHVKDLSGLSKEEMSRHLYETVMQRKIMHPIKESSQEDFLKLMPQETTPTPTPARVTSPVPPADREGRPPPIPPKNFAAFQVSKSSHHKEPSIDSLDKDEIENDYFVSMCEKADDLMDKCILAETQEDLSTALIYCDSALGCLKEAMNQTDISNKAQVYAQKKHNSCLLKSRSLFKRTSGHNSSDGSLHSGKRSSITSTDSDNSDKPVRRITTKERIMSGARSAARPGPQQPPSSSTGQQYPSAVGSHRKSPLPQSQPIPASSQPRNSQCGPQLYPSPSASSTSSSSSYNNVSSTHQIPSDPAKPGDHVNSTSQMQRSASAESEAIHTRSTSNTSLKTSSSTPCSMNQPQPQTVIRSQSSVNNTQMPTNPPMPIDSYGTLPRNRKPRRTSDPTGNSQVYQMYLSKQKNLQMGSSSDSRESDSSSCDGNGQRRNESSEMRNRQMQFTPGNPKNEHLSHSVSAVGSIPQQQNFQKQTASNRLQGPQTVSGQCPPAQSNQSQSSLHQHPAMSVPYPTSVSGYSQPLPGHRGVAHAGNVPNSSYHINQAGPPAPHAMQHHPVNHNIMSQSSQSSNNPNNLTLSSTQSNVQQIEKGVQNLNMGAQSVQKKIHINNRTVGPPPAPPARTTSNPDFRNQIPPQQYQHQQQYQQQQQQQVGSRTASNAASGGRVESNNHPSQQTANSYHLIRSTGPSMDQSRSSTMVGDTTQGGILKHANSSQGLHKLSLTPKPLERYASQPDCKNLVDSASHTNTPDLALSHSYYVTGVHPSSSNNQQNENVSSCTNVRLPQTSNNLSAPSHPPHQHISDGSETETFTPNVRALASRFDRGGDKPPIKAKPASAGPRTRSKSESGKKTPKSVLKSKKAKSANKNSKKSVTFAEDISNFASGYESAGELLTFSRQSQNADRAYFSDDEESSKPVSFSDNDLDDVEDSSNSDDSPLPREELACQLCRKREMAPGKSYCGKCSFYMSRLVSS